MGLYFFAFFAALQVSLGDVLHYGDSLFKGTFSLFHPKPL